MADHQLVPTGAPPRAWSLYFHGGAFVFRIGKSHWSTAVELSRGSRCSTVVPIYPRAPLATAVSVVGTATALTADLVAEDEAPLTVVGESAGAGLALAVCQGLAAQGVRPAALGLITSWLDLAGPHLRVPGLAVAARLYAGELPTADPRVSPLRGRLADVPPITVVSSPGNPLWADTQALLYRADELGDS